MNNHFKDLTSIFSAALDAVNPYDAVLNSLVLDRQNLSVADKQYNLDEFQRIVVVGAGKATAKMALAVEKILGERIDEGLIIIKDGHGEKLTIIEQVESSHPVPGEPAVAATQHMLNMMRLADEHTLIICLISGGASALLVSPVVGISLHDKQETTRLLLNAGATINELNAVRKHLSQVKGGHLAGLSFPAQMLTLVVSDVVGDPLDIIASGPTVVDRSTFAEAWDVIEKYTLKEQLPLCVAEYLLAGVAGKQAETVKAGNPYMLNVHNVIVASNTQAIAAAAKKSAQLGWIAKVCSTSMQGEAREVAHLIAEAARKELAALQPHGRVCLLYGGETTVAIKGNGKGGRNQEMALAFALEIAGDQGIYFLSAGTDGTDGPTDAAGAQVDGQTTAHARGKGLDALLYLTNNDSYTFFQRYDLAVDACAHLKTGPTGTNVMDLQIVLLETN